MVALAMWLVSAAVVSFAGIVALYGVAAVVIGVLLVAALPVTYLQHVLDECRHGHRERVRTRGRYFAPPPRTGASAPRIAPPPYRAPSSPLR